MKELIQQLSQMIFLGANLFPPKIFSSFVFSSNHRFTASYENSTEKSLIPTSCFLPTMASSRTHYQNQEIDIVKYNEFVYDPRLDLTCFHTLKKHAESYAIVCLCGFL